MMQKVEICGVDTSGLPRLTAKENEELMKKLKTGDKAAREKICENRKNPAKKACMIAPHPL